MAGGVTGTHTSGESGWVSDSNAQDSLLLSHSTALNGKLATGSVKLVGQVLTAPDGSGNPTSVTIPTSGGSGTSTYTKTPYDFGAVGNGSTDDTTAMQALFDWAATSGTAVIPMATFLTGPLKMHGKMTIRGMGMKSIIKAKTGSTGSLLSMDNVATSQGLVLENFFIDGNGQNLTNLYITNSNINQDPNDALHRIHQIWSYNAGIDAFDFGAAVVELIVTSCEAFNAYRYGFFIEVGCTDSRFTDCTTGASRSDGFRVVGNNNTFSQCKAFYAGFNRSTIGWAAANGWNFRPDSNQQLRMVSVLGCEAQNNAVHGFAVDGGDNTIVTNSTVQHTTLTGCLSDGNDELNSGGCGFFIRKSLNCTFTGNVTNTQSQGAQDYALSLSGDLSGTTFGVNDWSGGTIGSILNNSTGAQFVVMNSGSAGPVLVPLGSVLPGTSQGFDSPTGFNAMRVLNTNAGGSIQLVANTTGGQVSFYTGIDSTNVMNVNSARVQVNGILNVNAATPASATAAGNAGDVAMDSNYIYRCVANNTWKRTAISTW